MIVHFNGDVDFDLDHAEKDVALLGGVLMVKHHLLSVKIQNKNDREQEYAQRIGGLVDTIYGPRVSAQLLAFGGESDALFDDEIGFYRSELETVLGNAEGLAKYLGLLTSFFTHDYVEISKLADATTTFEAMVTAKTGRENG